MTQRTTIIEESGSATDSRYRLQEGDDWVCPNCSCEVRVRHGGDPERMQRVQPVTCCCGTQMRKEERG